MRRAGGNQNASGQPRSRRRVNDKITFDFHSADHMKLRFVLGLIVLAGLSGAVFANSLAVVLNSGENSISLVDRTTFAEVERINVGREPHHFSIGIGKLEVVTGNAHTAGADFLPFGSI